MHGVLNNWQTTILSAITAVAVPPFTVLVGLAEAARLTAESAVPFQLTLAQAAESETSAIELVTISAVNTGTGTLTISARAQGNTIAQSFPVASKIRLDATAQLFLELQEAAEAILTTKAAGQVYANRYLYDQ